MKYTAQGGLVVYDDLGNRSVTPEAKKKWVDLKVPYDTMLIIHAHQVRRVYNGWQLNFRAIDQHGKEHTSNLFVGDYNEMAKHHARILSIDVSELKDEEVLAKALNRLVGRCIAYTRYKKWLRPLQTSRVMRLDHFLRAANQSDV